MTPPQGCQACGVELPSGFAIDVPSAMQVFNPQKNWTLVGLSVGNSVIEVLLCPRCYKLSPKEVFDLRQDRINSGRDLGYH